MSIREQVEQYRAERPWLDHLGRTNFPDDAVVADLTLRGEIGTGSAFAYDCIADVPVDLKEALAPLADPSFEHPKFGLRPTFLAQAPTILVNFGASPHGGSWKPLPDHGGEPAISCRSFFHHSIVGSAAGCWGYFANKTSLESTFIVHKSGYFWQCMSLGEQADAQYHANGWAASAETEDNGDPNTDPWTAAQCGTLAWLTWEVDRLCPGMSLRVLPTWDASGFGYHSQFGAPSDLTPAVGKTCPGTIRKQQWREIIVPTILRGGQLVLDDDDRKWIDDKVTAMRAAIRDDDLRRLGHALVTGAPAGSNQQYNPTKPGYEWLDAFASAGGLNGMLRRVDSIVGALAKGLSVDAAALGAVLGPIVERELADAIEAHPVGATLDAGTKKELIEGAGASAAANIAARMAS